MLRRHPLPRARYADVPAVYLFGYSVSLITVFVCTSAFDYYQKLFFSPAVGPHSQSLTSHLLHALVITLILISSVFVCAGPFYGPFAALPLAQQVDTKNKFPLYFIDFIQFLVEVGPRLRPLPHKNNPHRPIQPQHLLHPLLLHSPIPTSTRSSSDETARVRFRFFQRGRVQRPPIPRWQRRRAAGTRGPDGIFRFIRESHILRLFVHHSCRWRLERYKSSYPLWGGLRDVLPAPIPPLSNKRQ